MKKINSLLALAIMVAGFSSCTKEDQTLDPKDSNNVLEFFNEVPDIIESSIESTYPMYSYSFPAVPGQEQPFVIRVNYAGAGVAASEIKFELEAAPDATTVYNTENHESFLQLPSSLYTMPTSGTIAAGQKYTDLTVMLKTADFDFSKEYTLTLRIKSATNGAVISKNYGTMLFRVNAKNLYDGVYKIVSGNVQRYTSPGVPTVNDGLNGSLAGNLNLVTINANTVEIQGMTWHGGASSVAGINNTRATVNTTTNAVTMFSLGNLTLANRAGMDNKYDPATKRFTLNFNWNQTAAAREISYVLEYLKAR